MLPLYPFQRETADFMKKGSCLNCSFCGSGKTITTLAAISEQGFTTNIIVCPKSVLFNWQNEIHHWLSDVHTFVATTNRQELYDEFIAQSGTKYLILTYDALRLDFARLKPIEWDAVVLDEVHYCVNPQSKRFKACNLLKAKVKYGLTATPVMNSATDVYGCVTVVKGPVLGNYYGFMARYCVKDIWGSVKYFRNMDQLAVKIQPYIIRKTLEEAEFQLPEKTETDLVFELSKDEASLYDRIKKELLFELLEAEVSKLSSPMVLQNTLTKLGKLQELTDSSELIGDSVESTKLTVLKEHLEGALANGEKTIIFTRFSRMVGILSRELAEYRPETLTGQTIDREAAISRFTTDKACRVFISTEAGSAGINLQAANILYNYDLPFSLGKLEQRIGRIHRHGQEKKTFVYNLIAQLPKNKQTVDMWVKNKLLKKQELSDSLLISDVKELLS